METQPLTLEWAEDKEVAPAALTEGSQPTGIGGNLKCDK